MSPPSNYHHHHGVQVYSTLLVQARVDLWASKGSTPAQDWLVGMNYYVSVLLWEEEMHQECISAVDL